MPGWNYPPGVTGNEWQIVGPDEREVECPDCEDVGIVYDVDDDGEDEYGAPIMRPIQWFCNCEIGRRLKRQKEEQNDTA